MRMAGRQCPPRPTRECWFRHAYGHHRRAVGGGRLVGIPPGVPPCVIGQWTMGTVRVTSMGLPLAAQAGVGITAPGPGALIPTTQQMRVQAK